MRGLHLTPRESLRCRDAGDTLFGGVTIGSKLSHAAKENLKRTAVPPRKGGLAASRYAMATRGRHTSENAAMLRSILNQNLGHEHLFPEEFSKATRAALLPKRLGKARPSAQQEVAELYEWHTGPDLDETNAVDVASGANQREMAVQEAAQELHDRLQGTAGEARLRNLHMHDAHVGGTHAKHQKHGYDHRAAAFDLHRRGLKLEAACDGPTLRFLPGSDTVVAGAQAVWKPASGRGPARINQLTVPRLLTLKTSERYEKAR